jgi:hypothetical protein
MKLSKRERVALKDIARHTRTPTKARNGYSQYWTPKTNMKLHEKGLVEFLNGSVIATDEADALLAALEADND